MTLNAVVDSLEGVPEALQEFYTQGEGGKYYLGLDGVDSLPSVQGLVKNKDDLARQRAELKKQLDGFEGIDADEYRKMVAAQKKAEKDGLVAKGDIAELTKAHEAELASVREQAASEVQAAQEAGAKKGSAAENYFRTAEITRAVSEQKGAVHMLTHEIEGRTQVEVAENGEFRLVVMENGTAKIKNSSSDPYTVNDLVTDLRADERWGRAFEASANSGSSADQGGKPAQKGGVIPFGDVKGFGDNLEAVAKGEMKVATQ